MQHVVIGIVLIVMGLVVIGLQPALKRGLIRNGATHTGVRVYGNVITGVVIVVFGVIIAVGGL